MMWYILYVLKQGYIVRCSTPRPLGLYIYTEGKKNRALKNIALPNKSKSQIKNLEKIAVS